MIDKNWILTSATCCKRDDIVTIKFNDYSVYYADDEEDEIISTLFHVHEDLDACLIRTAADMSEIVEKVPCINKVFSISRHKIFRKSIFLFRISISHHTKVLDVGIQDGEVIQ